MIPPTMTDEGISPLAQVQEYVREQYRKGHILGDSDALAEKIFSDGERQRWQGPARTWRTFADGYIRVHRSRGKTAGKGTATSRPRAHVTVCGLCWHVIGLSDGLVAPGDVVTECTCLMAAVARYTDGMTDVERVDEDLRSIKTWELLRKCQPFYQLPLSPECGGAAITAAISAQRHLVEGAHQEEYLARVQPWFNMLNEAGGR